MDAKDFAIAGVVLLFFIVLFLVAILSISEDIE